MRRHELCPYREGVVLEDTSRLLGKSARSLVDCGLDEVLFAFTSYGGHMIMVAIVVKWVCVVIKHCAAIVILCEC